MLLETEIDKRIQSIDRFGPDIAAASAVTAVGAAEFDKLLAAKRNAAAAAVAGSDVDLRFI
jgi:hypothetical protein